MPIDTTKQLLLNLPRLAKRGIAILSDGIICALTVWLAFMLRVDQWSGMSGNQWSVVILAVGLSLPIFGVFGLYRTIFRFLGSAVVASLGFAFFIYTLLFCFVIAGVGIDGVPRSIGIIQPILLFIAIGANRYLVRLWLGGIAKEKLYRHKKVPKALIYGAGSSGRQLAAALSLNQEIIIKGFLDDGVELQGNTINGLRVYSFRNITFLIKSLGITDILLALPSISQVRRSEIIASLSGYGVRVRTLAGVFDRVASGINISDLHDLEMSDLLDRDVVPPDLGLLKKNITGKSVLITGAGGSIGSELCRQIISLSPKLMILIDISEHSLYLIYEELKNSNYLRPNECETTPKIKLVARLASVRDRALMSEIVMEFRPDIFFHAAAYKHVPLVEQNVAEGIRNNVLGTKICAEVSMECRVPYFILISTDKAVRPTNIMGASKRISELILQSMAEIVSRKGLSTVFSMVRFGNVLGSSGSVAPLFRAQIKSGGPITVTHPEVTRYFMTIPEAAQLVIQSSAMAIGGEVFVLDMGSPVRIYDLALKMVYLSGLSVKDNSNPQGDVEIRFTGLRPGEKLYEELLIGENPQKTDHPKIMKAREDFLLWEDLECKMDQLMDALNKADSKSFFMLLKQLVPGYQLDLHFSAEVE